jgi:peptidoglycan/LPS O-acetylase OafA/YrhL
MECMDAILPTATAPAPPPPASPAPRPPASRYRSEEGRPAEPDEPPWLWRGTIPSLDGLRAVSIALVVVSHLALGAETGPFSRFVGAGALGVEMFFVISGFLITLLLLREQRRSDRVSVKAFYVRRAFRILPAYVCFLLGLFLLQCLGFLSLPFAAWVRPLTYTTSFFPLPHWDLAHTWSLSVEEHFYLLWPLAFVFFRPRGAFLAALLCVLLTPGIRAVLLGFLDGSALRLSYFTPTRMDAIAVGCCLAFLAVSPAFRRRALVSGARTATAVLLAATLLLLSLWALFASADCDGPGQAGLLGGVKRVCFNSVKPILLACLIWVCVTRPSDWFGKVLNAWPVAFLGKLSFSVYLWQQLFLNPQRDHWTCQYPMNLGCVLVAALLSYWLVEQPFLRLKERFQR